MQALELMKTYVIKATLEDSLSEAIDLMDLYQVNGLPVVDVAGKLVGFLSERDVLRALLPDGLPQDKAAFEKEAGRLQGQAEQVKSLRVGDFMTQPAIALPETTDIAEAAFLMLSHKLKRIPLLDEEGRVVGVLNRIDVLQALFEGTL